MSTNRENQLLQLDVGDEVIVSGRMMSRIGVIDRMTKTQFVVGNWKYNRATGFQVGGDRWNLSHIRVPSEGEAEKVRSQYQIHTLSAKFEATKWRSLTLETLEKINAILTTQPQSNE